MTVEELRACIGCLIRIKTELFWYDSRHWDGVSGRFCILLGVGSLLDDKADARGRHLGYDEVSLQLLLDGRPRWIILGEKSFEVVE